MCFVLPGLQRAPCEIDWDEFEPQLAVREETERRAHSAALHVRAGVRFSIVISVTAKVGLASSSRLIDGARLCRSLRRAADAIVGAMHTIVSAHPDLTAERAGQYTVQWLRRELIRLRAKDAARDASIDARIDAIRGKFPGLGFLA